MAILLPREKNASRNGGKASAATAASHNSVTPSDKTRDIDAAHIAKPKGGDGKATKSVFIKTYGCQMNVYDLSLIHI